MPVEYSRVATTRMHGLIDTLVHNYSLECGGCYTRESGRVNYKLPVYKSFIAYVNYELRNYSEAMWAHCLSIHNYDTEQSHKHVLGMN